MSFLETKAVGIHCVRDYAIRLSELKLFVKERKLSLSSEREADRAFVQFLNDGFLQGWEYPEATKYLAAQCNAKQEALLVLSLFVTYSRPGEGIQLLEMYSMPPQSAHYIMYLHSGVQQQVSKVDLCNQAILIDSMTLPFLAESFAQDKTENPQAPLFRTDYHKQNRLHLYRSPLGVKQHGGSTSEVSMRRYEAHGLVASNYEKLPKEVEERASLAPSMLMATCTA